ncbi:DUF4105 domain-containing protein [Gammaproteobacteria bacterium LSUCC0112]|nr:DUF4105 domain-containing protein [Gammaproteobacteria bacterium LSUCC0112]
MKFEACKGLSHVLPLPHQRYSLALVWLLWLALVVSMPAHVLAQDESSTAMSAPQGLPPIDDAAAIRVPADLNRVQFYLITVDVGNHLWDNFGHTALRMVDENAGTDIVFNWGLFDTSVGLLRFGANFARGVMEYQLGVSPPHWELSRYQGEARSVWQDRLVLTNPQKRQLYQRLSWNLRPENINYDYDYFFDNCTTRVRDYLDEALSGTLAERSQLRVQNTFRDEVQSHYANLPLIALSLDVLMNGRIDRQMSQWEQMFLPASLRQHLNSLGLLADGEMLAQFTPPADGPNPYLAVIVLLIPLILLIISVRKASIASFSSQPGFTLRAPALSYRVLGLIALAICLFSGVYGSMMVLGWMFSAHLDIHANINLLLFWPTDLLGLVVASRWLLMGKAPAVSRGRSQFIMLYMVLHVIAAVVYVLMGLTGLSAQDTTSLIVFVVPVLIVFALLVSVAGVRPVRSLRFT